MKKEELLRDSIQKLTGLSLNVSRLEEAYTEGIKLSKEDTLRIIKDLKKLHKRSDRLIEDYGVDLLGIETQYLFIIGTLLTAVFNSDQLNVIEFYLYEVDLLDIEERVYMINGREEKVNTLHQLWRIIQKLK